MDREHIYRCSGRPQLRVDVRTGVLFIRGWDGDEVRITEDTGARIWQKGDRIMVEGSGSCAARIYLPRASDVFIDGDRLDIDMGDIRGKAMLDVGGGFARIEAWEGNLDIDSVGGSVHLSQCSGQAKIDTFAGDVEIVSCRGGFSIDTCSGAVRVESSAGSVEADTGAGSVTLNIFQGLVHIDTARGNAELRGVASRNVFVDCGGGNIIADLPGGNPGSWQLSTASGEIVVQAPDDISARFKFQGPKQDLADLCLEDYWQEGELVTGSLNRGEGLVQVESGAGIITARKVPRAVLLWEELSPNDAQSREQEEETLKILSMLEKGTITIAEAEQLLDALRGEVNEDER